MRSNNQSIYALKAIACVFVVMIHCNTVWPTAGGDYIVAYDRFAVPLFAIITGYYSFYGSREECLINAKRRIRKIGKTCLEGVVVSFFLNCIASVIRGGETVHSHGLRSH